MKENESLKPKISVIVPVYKAEKYLRRCVDSIRCQTFKEFELILIDDGSPDGSGEICDEYARKDNRIRVFHKENGGVSSARQMGIDNARGEYTIHADPDDWVEPNMLDELYAKAIKDRADLVLCDFYCTIDGLEHYNKQTPTNISSMGCLKDLMFQRLHGALWNKLIKRDCYLRYNVKFPLDLDYCEDVIVLVQILQHTIKVSYVNEAFYHYDQSVNDNSISRNYTEATYSMRCYYLKCLRNYLNKKILSQVYDTQFSLVALECLNQNIYSNKEFYHIYKRHLPSFLFSRISVPNKILLILASLGMYRLICFYRTLHL